MNIENEIFKRTKVNIGALIPYGFVKNKNVYEYSVEFMNSFRADIVVDEQGKVSGKVIDLSTEDEYNNFRIENQVGEFVSNVRENYIGILESIRKHCFQSLYFISEQANRITNKIIEIYNDEPEFPWEKTPGAGILRNPNSKKWYALIMNIDKSKIDKKCSGEIEIINLKLDEEEIPNLLQKNGIYSAYHMNKKNWVSIILDDTLSDEEIMKYVSISHKYTEKSNEWIVPANPKYYDVINCFNDSDETLWKQSSSIKVGDIVYLYVAAPYSAILYKCEAVDVNIPYEYNDKNVSMKSVMKIKLLERYDKEYTFSILNQYGVNAIRGPRSMPEKLSKEMNKK